MATQAKTTAKPMNRPAATKPQASKPAAQAVKPQAAASRPPQQPPKAQVPATRPAPQQQQGAVTISEDMGAVPDFMQKYAGLGTEGTRREDLELPRLKLMQGLSPELQVYDALKAGHFFHTTSEVIFDQPFRAVVLYKQFRYILWNPLEAGGGILARADDGVHWQPADTKFSVKLDKKDGGHAVEWTTADTVARSGLANWGTMNPKDTNSPPAATLVYEYVLAFPDNPELMPAALSLQRSSIKQGKRLNTKIQTMKRFPMFGLVFNFSSFQDTNRNGQDFFNVNAIGAGHVADAAQLEEYHAQYEMFKSVGVRIKDEGSIQEEAGAYESGDKSDNAPEGSPNI